MCFARNGTVSNRGQRAAIANLEAVQALAWELRPVPAHADYRALWQGILSVLDALRPMWRQRIDSAIRVR